MKNNGLAEALSTVYGMLSVKNILAEKNYDRYMRAHGLATTALNKILVELIDPSSDDMQLVRETSTLFQSLLDNENQQAFDLSSLSDSPVVTSMSNVIGKLKEQVSCSKTSQLFVSYIEMYDILLKTYLLSGLGIEAAILGIIRT